MVLSRGNTEDLAAMYRGFTGHDPSIQPYLDFYGLSGGTAANVSGVNVPAAVPPVAPPPPPPANKTERGR
jgi:peptidyl-dipeptidase Dcp